MPGFDPISLLITLAVNFAISKVVSALTPKPKRQLRQMQVEYAGTAEDIRLIYGKCRVGGMHTIEPMVDGTSSEYLHQLLVWCGHEIDAVEGVYFDQTLLTTEIGAVTGTLNDGLVGSGTFANVAWVRSYRGTSTQTVDFILNSKFPAAWPSTSRLRGHAYTATRFKITDEVAYPNGKPEQTALIRGFRVYDPRLDSTNGGSGTQRYTDPTTWTFSQNGVLQLAHYLINAKPLGMGISPTKLRWDLFAAAATAADAAVAIPGSPSTQPRYTSNVQLIAGVDRHDENIAVFVESFQGAHFKVGDMHHVYAGVWRTPSFTITDADLRGKVSVDVVGQGGSDSVYNTVRSQYIDRARNYQLSDSQPIKNATFAAEDGRELERNEQWDACDNEYEAQRKNILVSRRSRAKTVWTVPVGEKYLSVLVFQTGTFSSAQFGIPATTVVVEKTIIDSEGFVTLVLRRDDPSWWSDPVVGDYIAPGSVTGVTNAPFTPSAPNNLTVTNIVDGILFAWDLPDVVIPGTTYNIYEHTANTPFSSAVLVASGLTGTSRTLPKLDTTTRYYWVKARGPSGSLSAQVPAGNGLAGRALTITTGFRATASSNSTGKTGTTAGLTSPSVTITPVNGVAPYTYAWSWDSGGTGITISSPTAATTTFSVAGMAVDENRNGVAKCVVTDSTGGTPLTFTVLVGVNFNRVSTS